MSRLIRAWVTVSAASGLLLLTLAPSYARGGLQHCLDQAANHNGEPPTCTKVNGSWVASWPDDATGLSDGSGGGIPSAVGFLLVVGALAAIGLLVWRVSTARKLAKQSGMDPGLATQMTLLSDEGLDATYLASQLRGSVHQPTAEPSATTGSKSSTASRLEELQGLLDRGLVTQAEYDERRRAIIDSL